MGLVAIAVRALVGYGLLLVIVRASGKRTISQSTPFNFVLALVLGDLVDDLLWAEVGVAQFMVAAGTLVTVEGALALAQGRSRRLHAWVTGEAAVLVRDGRPVPDALRRERMRETELDAHLRLHGLDRDRRHDVAIARLEPVGAVSIEKAARARPVERRAVSGGG